jgi:hypothetical protein
MAVTVIVGTNSYVDVVYADTYFESRFGYFATWSALTEDQKGAALISACQELGVQCTWDGRPTDESQALPFPRYPDTEVPDEIKIAQCEIAFGVVSAGVADPAAAGENPLKKLQAGSAVLEFDTSRAGGTIRFVNDYTATLLSKYGDCSFTGGGCRQIEVGRG